MSAFRRVFHIVTLTAIPMALLHTASALAQVTKSVEVLAIVEHPVLDAIRDGAKEQLKTEGLGASEDLKRRYQSTQGSTAIAAQIARKFTGGRPGAIVTVATPSTQAVVAATKSIPVVYSGVTDPVAAQLAKSWAPTDTDVTDVSGKLPLDEQVVLIRHAVPNAKRIGMVCNPGEANSVAVVTELKKLLLAQGMTLVGSAVPRTVDVAPAAKSLIDKVDVVYTSTDNNMVSTYESPVKVTNETRIPLVTGDADSVKRGAIATLGINYYKLSRQTGKVVARILKSEKPDTIASVDSSDLELFANGGVAREQGATLSTDLLEGAKEVVK